jgi:mannose-1-phosphate guanylyltransferase
MEPKTAGAGTTETSGRDGGRWAIVLAGGDGVRLRALTRELHGDDRPKQFARVLGDESLLERTWRRATLAVDPGRVLTVLTRRHERHYAPLVANVDPTRLVVQPDNRGTAAGILYPLVRLRALAPDARVAILPSDHHFSDDERLVEHVDLAFESLAAEPERVVLLGMIPDTHETEYGWIEPGPIASRPGGRQLRRVTRFREKPPAELARELRERGCLWNSFIMVGTARGLLGLVRGALPGLTAAFDALAPTVGGAREAEAAERLYAALPPADFSREVLAARPDRLGVLSVWGVSWCDLGSPARVLRTRRQLESGEALLAASA